MLMFFAGDMPEASDPPVTGGSVSAVEASLAMPDPVHLPLAVADPPGPDPCLPQAILPPIPEVDEQAVRRHIPCLNY
jgi:hypothetical protein